MIADMQGRYRDALSFEHEAMAIYREAGDRAGMGEVHFSIGSVYFYLGKYTEALKNYEEACAIATETGNRQALGKVVSGLGAVYSSAGRSRSRLGPVPEMSRDRQSIESEDEYRPGPPIISLRSTSSSAISPPRAGTPRKAALALLPAEGRSYPISRPMPSISKEWPRHGQVLDRAISSARSPSPRKRHRGARWNASPILGELYLAKGNTVKSMLRSIRAIVSVNR